MTDLESKFSAQLSKGTVSHTTSFASVKEAQFLQQFEHHRARSIALAIVYHPLFDWIMGTIIIVNFIIIVIETDETAALENGEALPSWNWTGIMNWVLMGIFICEMGLRLFAYRSMFWDSAWNKFDFTVVVTDAAFAFASLIAGTLLPISMLRILRLGKVARASKLLRVFPELRLMVAGLMGSLRAITWGSVLLSFVILVWSILAVHVIHPLNEELSAKGVYSGSGCSRCSRAYSSVWHSALTFSQQIVAGDSWGAVTIPLIEHYPPTAMFFICAFLTVGMAVLNLILGVVVNVASQEHDTLKRELEDEQRIRKMELQNQLFKMCSDMDQDGNGLLSKAEMQAAFEQREDFRKCFLGMDLEMEDLEILWTILDSDKTGAVDYEDFVKEVYKLRDSQTQFMLAYIKYNVTIIKDKVIEELRELKHLAHPSEPSEGNVAEGNENLQTLPNGSALEELELRGEMEVGIEHIGGWGHSQNPAAPSLKEDRKIRHAVDLQHFGTAKSLGPCLGDRRLTDFNPMRPAELHWNEFRGGGSSAAAQIMRGVLDDGRVQSQLDDTMSKINQNLELHVSRTLQLLIEFLPKEISQGPILSLGPTAAAI